MNGGSADTRVVIPHGRSRLPARLIVGVLSAGLLFVTVTHLGPAIRAGRREGTHGFWVATVNHCVRSACTWNGQFESQNGHVLLSSAQYAGRLPAGIHAGTHIAALFPGGSGLVYPPTGSDGWVSLLIGLALAVIGLSWSCYRLVRKYLRDRANATP
jgi:hypothetical protein